MQLEHRDFLEKAKKYLGQLKHNDLQEIKQVLSQLIAKLLADNETLSNSKLHHILSHLEALKHYSEFKEGKSIYLCDMASELSELIALGYKLLSTEFLVPSLTEKPVTQGSTISNEIDNHERELLYVQEQKLLDQNSQFHQLLKSIWRYVLDSTHHYPSKKVFISYAWPMPGKHNEDWSKQFVEKLAEHLLEAGFQVYLDEFQSGAGFPLDNFMETISKVDHVLVISSRTLDYKLKNPNSGVSQETLKIKELIEQKKKLLKDRSVIPVLLNNINYCDGMFKRLAEVPVCKEGYQQSLRALVQRMYGANNDFVKWFDVQATINSWPAGLKQELGVAATSTSSMSAETASISFLPVPNIQQTTSPSAATKPTLLWSTGNHNTHFQSGAHSKGNIGHHVVLAIGQGKLAVSENNHEGQSGGGTITLATNSEALALKALESFNK